MNLAAAFCLLLHILRVMITDFHESQNPVDRCTDIVAHALQEYGLGSVCVLCLFRFFDELFLVYFFLLHLFFLISLYRFPMNHLRKQD